MWDEIKSWYKSPYKSDMSATSWFVFLGFLLFAMVGWRIILFHVARDL